MKFWFWKMRVCFEMIREGWPLSCIRTVDWGDWKYWYYDEGDTPRQAIMNEYNEYETAE